MSHPYGSALPCVHAPSSNLQQVAGEGKRHGSPPVRNLTPRGSARHLPGTALKMTLHSNMQGTFVLEFCRAVTALVVAEMSNAGAPSSEDVRRVWRLFRPTNAHASGKQSKALQYWCLVCLGVPVRVSRQCLAEPRLLCGPHSAIPTRKQPRCSKMHKMVCQVAPLGRFRLHRRPANFRQFLACALLSTHSDSPGKEANCLGGRGKSVLIHSPPAAIDVAKSLQLAGVSKSIPIHSR